jgi:hypothetical protein
MLKQIDKSLYWISNHHSELRKFVLGIILCFFPVISGYYLYIQYPNIEKACCVIILFAIPLCQPMIKRTDSDLLCGFSAALMLLFVVPHFFCNLASFTISEPWK